MLNLIAKESKKYISLQEAAEYSEIYSQGYLSLRARQGKLKAVKLGRNWVTTKAWVSEYVNSESNVKASELSKNSFSKIKKANPADNSIGLACSLAGCLVLAGFALGFSGYNISNNLSNNLKKVGGLGVEFGSFTADKSLQFFNKTGRFAWGLSLEYETTLDSVFGDMGQVFSEKTKLIAKLSKNGGESLLNRSQKLKNIALLCHENPKIYGQEAWQAVLGVKKAASNYFVGFPLVVKDKILDKTLVSLQGAGASLGGSVRLMTNNASELSLELRAQTSALLSEARGVVFASLLNATSQGKKDILNGKNSLIEISKNAGSTAIVSIKKGAMLMARPWLEKK